MTVGMFIWYSGEGFSIDVLLLFLSLYSTQVLPKA